MIDKNDVITFFDKCAPTWDDEMIRDDAIISTILDNAGVGKDMDILDVACGTGVLFDDYLGRGVSSVTGIDISSEMAKRAGAKYSDPRVKVICGDILTVSPSDQYDVVMVYNAFPHFPDPEALIKKLCQLTKPGGRVSIAHGMSREKINAHHSGSAKHVSNGLLSVEELRDMMSRYLDVDIVISDSLMYQVCGTK